MSVAKATTAQVEENVSPRKCSIFVHFSTKFVSKSKISFEIISKNLNNNFVLGNPDQPLAAYHELTVGTPEPSGSYANEYDAAFEKANNTIGVDGRRKI